MLIYIVEDDDNIRELEEKNNTRVLKGLMEDFMDIEDLEKEEEKSKQAENERKKTGIDAKKSKKIA